MSKLLVAADEEIANDAWAQPNPPQITRPASNKPAVVTSGAGQYYFEFRSRQAWDYGHTFVVFGRVGEAAKGR